VVVVGVVGDHLIFYVSQGAPLVDSEMDCSVIVVKANVEVFQDVSTQAELVENVRDRLDSYQALSVRHLVENAVRSELDLLVLNVKFQI